MDYLVALYRLFTTKNTSFGQMSILEFYDYVDADTPMEAAEKFYGENGVLTMSPCFNFQENYFYVKDHDDLVICVIGDNPYARKEIERQGNPKQKSMTVK